MKFAVVTFVFLALAPAAVSAQEAAEPEPVQQQQQVLRVFLDCSQCDFNNIRQDIDFVAYVADKNDADVHVLITTRDTATRGREYTFQFIGQGAFADVQQRQIYVSNGTDMDDEQRRGVSRTFSLGLTPFLIRTPQADRFSLRYARPAGSGATNQSDHDPWNYWIFRLGSSLELNGEERQKSDRIRANFSANRTTEAWKISFSSYMDFNNRDYKLSSGSTLESQTKSWSLSGSVIKSIGTSHWAALTRTELRSSSQSNERRDLRQSIGLEWDLFPYAESTRRSFVVQYSVGLARVQYFERTLFDKTKETLADHRLATILALRQPWGTTRASAAYSAYLHDKSKYNIDLFADADIRLFRGFSLNVEASFSRVRNQLYLSAGQVSDEEILLRLRQLATGYRYRTQIGFSYQFGSIYNNVVNPRWSAQTGRGFGGPGGGGG